MSWYDRKQEHRLAAKGVTTVPENQRPLDIDPSEREGQSSEPRPEPSKYIKQAASEIWGALKAGAGEIGRTVAEGQDFVHYLQEEEAARQAPLIENRNEIVLYANEVWKQHKKIVAERKQLEQNLKEDLRIEWKKYREWYAAKYKNFKVAVKGLPPAREKDLLEKFRHVVLEKKNDLKSFERQEKVDIAYWRELEGQVGRLYGDLRARVKNHPR